MAEQGTTVVKESKISIVTAPLVVVRMKREDVTVVEAVSMPSLMNLVTPSSVTAKMNATCTA